MCLTHFLYRRKQREDTCQKCQLLNDSPSFAKYPVNVLWNNILVFSLHTILSICIQFLSQLKNWGRIYFYLWLVLYFRHGQKCLLGDAANAEKYAVEHKKAHKAVPWCCDRCPAIIGALESSWRRQCLGQVLWVEAWIGGVRGSISKLSGGGTLWSVVHKSQECHHSKTRRMGAADSRLRATYDIRKIKC